MKKNLFDIDFDKMLIKDYDDFFSENKYSEDEYKEYFRQTDKVINNITEKPEKRAWAYIIKFQLLMYQYKLAPKLLENALQLCPNMPQALIRMGVYHYKKDRNKKEMLKYINKALRINPTYENALLLKASIIDNNSKMIELIKKYQILNPKCLLGYQLGADSLYKQLEIYELKKNTENISKEIINEIIYFLTKLIKLNPKKTNSNNYLRRGELYLLLDNKYNNKIYRQKAMSDLITYFKNDVDKYNEQLSTIFCDIKLSIKKIYFTHFINTVPKNNAFYWKSYIKLAGCFYVENNYLKAVSIYTYIIDKAKDPVIHLLAYSGRAHLYSSFGEYYKELNDYREIIKNKCSKIPNIPHSLSAVNAYNWITRYYSFHKYNYKKGGINIIKKAIKDCTNAIKIADDHWLDDFYFKRAELYAEINENEKAIEDCTFIIESKPTSILNKIMDAYELRKILYKKTGNIKKYQEEKRKYFKYKKLSDEMNSIDNLLMPAKKYKVIN